MAAQITTSTNFNAAQDLVIIRKDRRREELFANMANLPKEILLFEILKHFNPFNSIDQLDIREIREIEDEQGERLISDTDLREVYYKTLYDFHHDEFPLAGWRDMTLDEMKEAVLEAHPFVWRGYSFQPEMGPEMINELKTKEDVLNEFSELVYTPKDVYMIDVAGSYVTDMFRGLDLNDPETFAAYKPRQLAEYLRWICLDYYETNTRLIRALATNCDDSGIDEAARSAASCGHIELFDLLVEEFDAWVDEECMARAAGDGQILMIDHLIDTYGLNPRDKNRLADADALKSAAMGARLKTVKHLVEKYGMDPNAKDDHSSSALEYVEEWGWKPEHDECAMYFRSLPSFRHPARQGFSHRDRYRV